MNKNYFRDISFGVNLLSTKEVAEILDISKVRVFQLIQEGILPAQKVGRDWFMKAEDVEVVKNRPNAGKAGRPPKKKK